MVEPVPRLGDSDTCLDPMYPDWLRRKKEWWRWHQDNPMVWEYFKKYAFEALDAGVSKTGHWYIMGAVRWTVFIETSKVRTAGGELVKLSNDHFAWYARLWKVRYPQHSKLFLTKHMIGEPADSPLLGRK